MPDQVVTDYREAFRRAARPGYDPHELLDFYHPFASGPTPGPTTMALKLVGRLHGMRGTLEAAAALIEFAGRLGPEDVICTFHPGSSGENPDFGVIAVERPGADRMLGFIRFRRTGTSWEEGQTP